MSNREKIMNLSEIPLSGKNDRPASYVDFDPSILTNKKQRKVSATEALKDIVPFEWPEDVMSGKRKVYMDILGGNI